MPGLFRNDPETPEGRYLVQRRDGSVVEWPSFVLGARDPAAPAALRTYADEADRLGMDPQLSRDVRALADDYEAYLEVHGPGDPDGPRHRVDDPKTVAKMRVGRNA